MLEKQSTTNGSGRINEIEYFNLIIWGLKRIRYLFKAISKANSTREIENILLDQFGVTLLLPLNFCNISGSFTKGIFGEGIVKWKFHELLPKNPLMLASS